MATQATIGVRMSRPRSPRNLILIASAVAAVLVGGAVTFVALSGRPRGSSAPPPESARAALPEQPMEEGRRPPAPHGPAVASTDGAIGESRGSPPAASGESSAPLPPPAPAPALPLGGGGESAVPPASPDAASGAGEPTYVAVAPTRPGPPDAGRTPVIIIAPAAGGRDARSTTSPPAAVADAGAARVDTSPPVAPAVRPDARSATPDAGVASTEMGTLSVTTQPPTRVFLDDEPPGLSPFSGRAVPAGRHRTRFVSEAFGIRREEPVSISAGRETQIRRTEDQLRAPSEPGVSPAAGPSDAGRATDGVRLLTPYGGNR